MEVADKTLVCRVCGERFVWTAGEQLFFDRRHLARPKRCQPCRQNRRRSRLGSVAVCDRLEAVAANIRRVASLEFTTQIVPDVEGDALNAAADTETHEIVVTEGLIDKLDADELSWVLAHEVAHIEHKDGSRRAGLIATGAAQSRAMLSAADRVLRVSGGGVLARIGLQLAGSLVAGAAVVVASRSQSRTHELEADVRAVEIGKRLGIEPEAAVRALEKCCSRSFDESFLRALVRTHPSLGSRLRSIAEL